MADPPAREAKSLRELGSDLAPATCMPASHTGKKKGSEKRRRRRPRGKREGRKEGSRKSSKTREGLNRKGQAVGGKMIMQKKK